MSVVSGAAGAGEVASGASDRLVVVQRLVLAMMAWLVVMQFAVERSAVPPIGLIQAAFIAVPAVLLARGWRHAAVLTVVFAGVMLLAAVPSLAKDLTRFRR